MTYPTTAITKFFTISGSVSGDIETSYPSIVYGIRMQQEKDMSETQILCGSEVIAYNWAKDYPLSLTQYRCNGALSYTKTGNDEVHLAITYTTSTKDYAGLYDGFTYGDLVSSAFLFFVAFLGVYAFYWWTVHRPVKP